ncbi:MAG TPA: hypothetical protein P5205_21495 [Candidatus Paceibacterota bacterium]|nr:hypothetical protein [Candidatus Paceibacterota bacterium]
MRLELPFELAAFAEVCEVFLDGPFLARDEVVLISLVVLHPEDLGQGNDGAGIFVGEYGQYAGLLAFGSVELQDRRCGIFLAGGTVGPADVGLLGAVFSRVPKLLVHGGIVVGKLGRRDEKRSQCVGCSGLATSIAAGDERPAAVRDEAVDLSVEGAPVENLEALQAESGQGGLAVSRLYRN